MKRFWNTTALFQAPDAPSSPAPAGSSGDTGSVSTSSTPSSTPATSPASTDATPSSATPASTDGVDSSFDFMFNTTNEDPLEGLGLPTTEPKPVPKALVQPAPVKQEPPVQTPTTPATAQPQAPAPTEPTSPAAGPSLDPYDPGALAQHLAQNEEQAVQYAAENLFKLSPKDVEDLESNVVEAIPKLLARTLVASQRNFLMQLSQLIPTMIQRHGQVEKAHTQAVGEFYTRWPDLNAVKDQKVAFGNQQVAVGDLVTQYASVFRKMNPQASRQEAIEYVGPLVMMAAKIVPSQASAAPPARPNPMAQSNGRPPQPAPFVPAGPSGGGAFQTSTPQLTPVEAMFVGDEG